MALRSGILVLLLLAVVAVPEASCDALGDDEDKIDDRSYRAVRKQLLSISQQLDSVISGQNTACNDSQLESIRRQLTAFQRNVSEEFDDLVASQPSCPSRNDSEGFQTLGDQLGDVTDQMLSGFSQQSEWSAATFDLLRSLSERLDEFQRNVSLELEEIAAELPRPSNETATERTGCDCDQVRALTENCLPLLVQQNKGSSTFNRSWDEYKTGFNDTQGNYWIGNELLHQVTAASGHFKLRFELQSKSSRTKWYWAQYDTFIVLDENVNYRLIVDGFTGSANFDAMELHNGMQFTTYDRDNDLYGTNCARIANYGGFWYRGCSHCRVNCWGSSFDWHRLPGGNSLATSRMWLVCP